MTVSFYADVHVRIEVVHGLRARGVDVLRAQEDGMDEAKDPDLLDRATSLGRVMVTQDDDFLVEAARRQRLGLSFAGIIYGHQQRVTISSMIRDLELIAFAMSPDSLRDSVEHLPY